MKFLKTVFLILCLLISAKSYAAHQLYADIDGINIPYGTKISLIMKENITSKIAVQGDSYQASLAEDIYVNNKLVLPSGTIFRGRVSKVIYSKMLSKPAKLYLTLDHLVTKFGSQLPVNSGLATNFNYILKSDGALTTNGNYFNAVKKDYKKSGNIVKKTANWGVASGEELFTGGKYLITPIAVVGGSIACVGYAGYSTIADLFKHGDDIIIKKGEKFDIILLTTLEIPS